MVTEPDGEFECDGCAEWRSDVACPHHDRLYCGDCARRCPECRQDRSDDGHV